uniref:Uncharacterized protein n=1 Tax=Peronospora matthiolae TaxID=2874970 RepID=A0AAV1VLV3_9STRA
MSSIHAGDCSDMPAASANAMRARAHHKKEQAFRRIGALPGIQMISNPDKIVEHGSTTRRRLRMQNEVVICCFRLAFGLVPTIAPSDISSSINLQSRVAYLDEVLV